MYWVLLEDSYGTILNVRQFDTRHEAVRYIANLPDDYYMVTLRNDDLKTKTLDIE